MIEQFTKEEFEKALPAQAKPLGIVNGEYMYRLDLGDGIHILIRSSITNGIADGAGEDSIRVFMRSDNRKVFISDVAEWKQPYVTRQPGWQDRMNSRINTLMSIRQQAGNCKTCGSPKNFSYGKKPGTKFFQKPYSSCSDFSHNSFVAIDINKPAVPYDKFDWSFGKSTQKNYDEHKDGTPLNVVELADQVLNDKVVFDASRPISRPSLSRLNGNQLVLVQNGGKGIASAEACPGSGKTTTLTYLVSEILAGGIDPRRILCCTYSVKAAEELRVRIAKLVWPDISDEELEFFKNPKIDSEEFNSDWVEKDSVRKFLVQWVCTIHAVCNRLLKAHGDQYKISAGQIEKDAMNMIKDSIKELGWEENPKSIRSWISIGCANGVSLYNAEQFYSDVIEKKGGQLFLVSRIAEIYRRYVLFLKRRNAMDFDQMQARTLYLMRSDPAFKSWAQSLFDFVLVDEFQDTSGAQAEIVWTLAEKSGNFTGFGDADQSMYAFRGAVPDVLRGKLEQRWGEVKRFPLSVNYRSGRNIISASTRLINSNYMTEETRRYLKEFSPRENAPEGKIGRIVVPEFDELCQEIINSITATNPGEWFVLSRTRAECAAIHTALIGAGIPAINKSGGFLFGSSHIRKVIAYAKLACNYHDARNDAEVLEEIANVATSEFLSPTTKRSHVDGCNNEKGWINCGCPVIAREGMDHSSARYYGKKAIQDAMNWKGVELQQYERVSGHVSMRAHGAQDLVSFVYKIEKQKDSAASCLRMIIDDCVLPWLEDDEGIDVNDLTEGGKQEDFDVIMNMVEEGQTTEQFLDRIEDLTSKSSNGSSENGSALVGTIHWSKGAERDRVFVNLTRCPIVPPKIGKGKLPALSVVNVEEERRLAFVAVTRAKEEAVVGCSLEWMGLKSNHPSIFMNELFELEDHASDPNVLIDEFGDIQETE